MPVTNPLIQGGAVGGGTPPPAAAGTPPPTYNPPPSTSRFAAIGAGGFGGPDNTSVHCGILIAGALIFVIVWQGLGFRSVVDARVARG